MTKHILLVEPDYYSQYPPLGLLKLSSYHKKKGDTTELVHGLEKNVSRKADVVYITSLFTWAWKPVWEALWFYTKLFPQAEIWLGGLYASLMPEHAALSSIQPNHIFKGIHEKAEVLLPDYRLVPKWNKTVGASIVFSSRGCARSCSYCAVPFLEGKMNSVKYSIKDLIWDGHSKVVFFDNNILASSGWRRIFDELADLSLKVDFNQGLDARLITEEVASKISELKIDPVVRLSYDYREMETPVQRAINLLKSHGIDGRTILVYALYNFTDDPEDFFERIRKILRWGAVCYPMRYQPINALYKDCYIAPKWDAERLEAVQRARRVIGYGGAFPPYEGLVNKFENVEHFDEAFGEFIRVEEATL